MATIRKRNARKNLEDGLIASSGVSMDSVTHGLIFEFSVGDHKVKLTHVERDYLIKTWQKMEKDWEASQ